MLIYVNEVHAGCRASLSKACSLGQSRVSMLPPTAITNLDSDGFWRATRPPGTSPLLVFLNSKSGDSQVTDFHLLAACRIIHRRRLHGGDGGDRSHGQKVVGAMPPSCPHKNFDRLISKVHSFNCYIGYDRILTACPE